MISFKTLFDRNSKKHFSFDALGFFMIIVPVLIAGTVALIYRMKTGLTPLPGLKWNDEAAYYQLIKTCLATGQPLGYWGFDGNHAILGTGSAWSPAILWPYAVWGYLIPLTDSFVYFINLIYILFANLTFYFCVMPDKRQKIRLILLQATSSVFILYLSVNMSEILRFAIAIVLAGMFYRLFFKESGKIFRYVIIPIFIVAAVQVYVFYAFCIPIYVFAVMKESKLWKKLLISFASMGTIALGSYYLLHLISSNYNIYKTEALLEAVKNRNFLEAIKAFLRMFKQGAIGVLQLFQYLFTNPMIVWHLLFCALLVVICVILIVKYCSKLRQTKPGRKNSKIVKLSEMVEKANKNNPQLFRKDMIICVIVCYSIILFLGMYMTLYSIDLYTFMRGTQIVVMFSLYLLAMTENKVMFRIILAFQVIGMLALPMNMDYYMEGRYMTQDEQTEWENLENRFSSVFELRNSKEKYENGKKLEETVDPWDNTIVLYTMEPKVICAMPAGIGVNLIIDDDSFPKQAKYLLFSKTEPDKLNSEWLEKDYQAFLMHYGNELRKKYEVLYEDGEYIIYCRK